MIYVSGSECIGRCGQLPLKGSASSDLDQFVRIVTIKSLNSNCVLVLLFQVRLSSFRIKNKMSYIHCTVGVGRSRRESIAGRARQ